MDDQPKSDQKSEENDKIEEVVEAAPQPKAEETVSVELAAPKAVPVKSTDVFKVGDLVKIEKIVGPLSPNSGPEDYKEGDKFVFDKVLLLDDGKADATIGTPFIEGRVVNATLNKIARYKPIDVIKYKQKSRYFKKYGHRQPYFEVKIDSIK